MTERKLILAIPCGKLIEPKNFGVDKFLRLAEVGEYVGEGNDLHFESNDPEVEGIAIRPRSVPLYLSKGHEWRPICHAGITGADIYEDFRASLEGGVDIHQVRDLQCGYVDLCFMTSNKIWNSVQKLCDADKKRYEKLDNLEKLISILSLPDRRELITCSSEYLPLGRKLIEDAAKKLGIGPTLGRSRCFLFDYSHGRTEKHIVSGAANIILETTATGKGVKDNDLFVLKKVMGSTAGLYMSSRLVGSHLGYKRELEGVYELEAEEQEWAQKKIRGFGDKIKRVTDDIGNHCQVNMLLDGPALYKSRHLDRLLSAYGLTNFDHGSACSRHISGSNLQEVLMVFSKKDLPAVKIFLKNLDTQGIDNETIGTGNGISKLRQANCFNLGSLYAYCPLFINSDYFVSLFYTDNKYPCADPTKLRLEHVKDATIFTFERKA